jgi:hypothetical protein
MRRRAFITPLGVSGDELALSAGVTGFQILGPSNWMLPLRGA